MFQVYQDLLFHQFHLEVQVFLGFPWDLVVQKVLMGQLHHGLKRGMTTDEALRQAQLALISGSIEVPVPDGGTISVDASHPYAWAGFELHGDWR